MQSGLACGGLVYERFDARCWSASYGDLVRFFEQGPWIHILDTCPILFIDKPHKGRGVFQPENTPAHVSTYTVQKMFFDMIVDTLSWLARSLDSNHVESVLALRDLKSCNNQRQYESLEIRNMKWTAPERLFLKKYWDTWCCTSIDVYYRSLYPVGTLGFPTVAVHWGFDRVAH